MNYHPAQLETLVRARTETLIIEAQQERLAEAVKSGRAPFRFSNPFRRPSLSTPRVQLASQAGC